MKFTVSTLLFAAAAAAAVSTVSAETWKITNEDSGSRQNLCALQVSTCQNNCGGPDQAPMAFCNTTTMAWGCGCLKKTPDFETWNWPIPAADCKGSNDVCVNNCNGQSGDRSKCFISCQDTHKCNTEDAPVSYTETDDTSTEPRYVGPAVSYKGDKLGDLNDGNDRSNLVASEDESSSNSDDSSSKEGETDKEKDSKNSDATSVFKTASLALAAVVFAAVSI
ncbi:hypothetical protein LPJ64_005784 [Coemansia asiatica]|uniref:DUF7707 domain-containing protein n=1 Tax=Coemansia asiatica TaxID=1052880 RepID=A0A9W7XDP9_9FUNG|nr:hypothetical protein LPJ64_005784 [Coemansia asiatica]